MFNAATYVVLTPMYNLKLTKCNISTNIWTFFNKLVCGGEGSKIELPTQKKVMVCNNIFYHIFLNFLYNARTHAFNGQGFWSMTIYLLYVPANNLR